MRIGEVNAVVLEVLQPFNLVPLELHLRSVYTPWTVCNAGACCPITPQFSGRAPRYPARSKRIMKWRACCAHVSGYHGPLQLLVRRHRAIPTTVVP